MEKEARITAVSDLEVQCFQSEQQREHLDICSRQVEEESSSCAALLFAKCRRIAAAKTWRVA